MPASDNHMSLPFALETPLEHMIAADPQWSAGIAWGRPRAGHPEGRVVWHIREVLGNIDDYCAGAPDRARLRLIALTHDTFKYQAARGAPGRARPTHGWLARQFAQRYIADTGVLEVIELHDEAYKIWRALQADCDLSAAERRARGLLARLGAHQALYMAFYNCDCRSGDKSIRHYQWFEQLARALR